MTVAKNSASYPVIIRQLVERISQDTPHIRIPTNDLKGALRYRILFYGYRTALRRETDKLLYSTTLDKSAILQSQYLEKSELLRKADLITPRPLKDGITFYLAGYEPDAPQLQLPDGTPLSAVAIPTAIEEQSLPATPQSQVQPTQDISFDDLPDMEEEAPGSSVVDLFLNPSPDSPDKE